MKYVYTTMAGFALVALAFAPAGAGDQKSKTSDTLQLPGGYTDSPSASPSTLGTTDSTLNPSVKSDPPAGAASPKLDDQSTVKDKDMQQQGGYEKK